MRSNDTKREAPPTPTAQEGFEMKKAMNLVLEGKDLIELMRILMDEDERGALAFLHEHFKAKARGLLEGG